MVLMVMHVQANFLCDSQEFFGWVTYCRMICSLPNPLKFSPARILHYMVLDKQFDKQNESLIIKILEFMQAKICDENKGQRKKVL